MEEAPYEPIVLTIDPDFLAAQAWCEERFGPPHTLFARVRMLGGWAAKGSIFMFADPDAAFETRLRWAGKVYDAQ